MWNTVNADQILCGAFNSFSKRKLVKENLLSSSFVRKNGAWMKKKQLTAPRNMDGFTKVCVYVYTGVFFMYL